MSGIMPNRPLVKTVYYTKEELDRDYIDFDICGGTDQPVIPGDPGIFLTTLESFNSPNFKQKGLQIGNRLLEINGYTLESVTNLVSIIDAKLTDKLTLCP